MQPAGSPETSPPRGSRVLSDALSALSEEERETLDVLVSRVLVGLKRDSTGMRFMCRLCDASACGHAEGGCPVAPVRLPHASDSGTW